MKKKTQEEFINDSKLIHGDKYDYSKVIYKNNREKVIIICKIHGEFLQSPDSHIHNHGCIKCSKKYNYSTKDWIEKAKEIHENKYDYSKVEYKNSKEKVLITCLKHGDFLQNTTSHLNGNGCSKCVKTYNYSTDEWIEKAKETHGDKYDYSKVIYKNNRKKVIIICYIHGDFLQNPNMHLIGNNCPKCSMNYHYSTDEWIKKAQEIHGNKYDYSKVEYKSCNINVIIICPKHGQFLQTPSSHVNNYNGCSKCSQKYQYSTEEWIEKAKKTHGNKYNYLESKYKNNKEKVLITCLKHGNFLQLPSNHIRGNGCPKCQMCPLCLLWMTHGKLCQYCKPKKYNNLYKKTKEMDVVKYLRNNLPDIDFIHNKSVGLSCTGGHYFPDIRFDCIWFQLIIEVDENRHRGANYKCDEKRMYDITAKLGQPCIFIRYNPDHKESNKELLLERTQYYLNLQDIYLNYENFNKKQINYYAKLDIDNILGFKTEYLFY